MPVKVICRGHKTCKAIDCFHAKPHIPNSWEYSNCVDVEGSSCFCSEDKQEIRKEKLKKLNYESNM